jgi:hypothetical protein
MYYTYITRAAESYREECMLLLRLYILAGGLAIAGGSLAVTTIENETARMAARGAFEVVLIVAAVTIGANMIYRLVERHVIASLREAWHAIHANDVDDVSE